MWLRINDINELPLPRINKARFLLKNIPNSTLLKTPPKKWREGLVCIVKNKYFEAACYAGNQNQMDLIMLDSSKEKQWMLIPDAKLYAK